MNTKHKKELADLMNMAKGHIDEAKYYIEGANNALAPHKDEKSLHQIREVGIRLNHLYEKIDDLMKDLGIDEF